MPNRNSDVLIIRSGSDHRYTERTLLVSVAARTRKRYMFDIGDGQSLPRIFRKMGNPVKGCEEQLSLASPCQIHPT